MPKKIPVCIMTYERADYFHKSMQSLFKTDLSKGEITVFDDCSQEDDKIKILKDYEQKGIKIVVGNKQVQTKRMFLKMLKYGVDNYDTDCVVIAQDDIVYNKQWLNKLLEIKNKISNLGILTPWDRRCGLKSNKSGWIYRNLTGNKHKCTIGGICWLVTKKLALDILKTKCKGGNQYDSAYQKHCANKGFNIASTIPSYVQHFGATRMVRRVKERKRFPRAGNFIGEE